MGRKKIIFLISLGLVSWYLQGFLWAATSPAKTDNNADKAVQIAEGDTLANVLAKLVALTNCNIYLLGPVDLRDVTVDPLSGPPQKVLKMLLSQYSYGILCGENLEAAFVEVVDSVCDGDCSDSRAEEPSRIAGQGSGISREATRALSGDAGDDSMRIAEDEPLPVMNDDSQLAVSEDKTSKRSVTNPEDKKLLAQKIEQLEGYINSGEAEDQYNFWAEKKDPEYLYNPWEELERLKKTYAQL